MEIAALQAVCAAHPQVGALCKVLDEGQVRTLYLERLCASAAPLFLSTCVGRWPFLFVLNDGEEASYFYHDLVQVCGGERVLFLPPSWKRSVRYAQRDAANVILRTEVLERLRTDGGRGLCIVTSPEALAELVVEGDVLERHTLRLQTGGHMELSAVAARLEELGMQRVDYVYEPGQFAVRGSLVDVFSYASEWPYRIDFFGDEIDSIRTFEVESQLSRERQTEVSVVPALEGGRETVSLFGFLPAETVLGFRDFAWVADRIEAVHGEQLSAQALVASEAETGERPQLPPTIGREEFERAIGTFRRMEFGARPTGTPEAVFRFDTTAQPLFHKNFDLVSEALRQSLAEGYRIYILSDSAKQTDRLQAIFADRGDDISFTPVDKTLHEGFADGTLRCCFYTDHQLFDRFHKYSLRSDRARGGKVALTLKELNQFEPGDYIVHIDHGVGRFAGLVRIPSGNTTQEAIKIVYANDDVVFVSIHSLHKVSKYKGKEGEPPRLNRLGTGAWEKLKERTKSKIKDIARDLIQLYARRREERGYAYSPDTFLQHELEASFLYEDTPDQQKATQAVKTDMERERPMDRLICGDVGFGKTEVAVRAAFKAVSDNKQVAVLVPTTVLALQHYKTFSERLKNFPCRVDYLSRARKPADVRKVLRDVAEGEVHILIGTHRIIGKDVRFKDLGLLIIDEEQKFGVAVKEKLKQLRVNVDTLTLTATPIPRTLQFSLMGARDLSVIQTPPPNRYPIQTEVHTFSEELIADAVNFEMSRNGQVFFVNNRIQNLPELQGLVQRLVPDARVCVGHGQMPPEELERVILDFVNYDYDVLIATSIIESGVDMPNVNTILINQAQNFGLSDLHQMRGRVGRSNRKAFCYLMAPPLTSLTTEARRRLQAIENFSDLGSGIHIAMQDLDIRGAGNLLGAEQSGFIADLGYETYQKILAEAVTELKNDEFADLYMEKNAAGESADSDFVADCTFESDLELLFPADYIPSSSERMLLYRELDSLEQDEEVEAFRTRLEDRFGKVPPESLDLLQVVPLRRWGKRFGAERILLKGGRMTLFFVSNPDSPYYRSDAFGRVIAYMGQHPRDCNLREQNGKRSMAVRNVTSVETAVAILKQISGTSLS